MNQISISDVTMKRTGRSEDFELSFKEKIDLGRILDRLNVSVIEVDAIEHHQTDSLLLKSLSASIHNSTLAVPVKLNKESVAETAAALKEAKSFRIQIPAPVSAVQMEYLCHKKTEGMIETIKEMVAECKKYTDQVELLAYDATRAESDFLKQALSTAIEAGVSQVTLYDTAGLFLPDEFVAFLKDIKESVAFGNVKLGVCCSNALSLADACTIAAVEAGVDEIKVAACGDHTASLAHVAQIIAAKGKTLDAETHIRNTELHRGVEQITRICRTFRSKNSPFDNGVSDEETSKAVALNSRDDLPAVMAAVKKLGYDLSEEDGAAVYEAFLRIAARKESVGRKELESIVASAAMQVPPTYRVESYVINSGNIITATAHMKLRRDDRLKEGISTGDGPIDAAFLAIEQIVGHHYELDDFQIQAVTEGREAMGETVVKLRSNGKLYSGRGVSTDIVGSSIRAYVNALNKIVYEED